ncbi:CbtA family protein [Actinacidiphila yeochonensis]|uniref:CbtA family protein n=1 Tax=Actinacidiphila yeochonensis TaxID=89050 RepID=UPI000561CE57|nr:CbtA family protein [Actinacidiphila yeochonensis]
MEKRLILRGVIAGAVGGLLAFVFARIFAEPQIAKAIDYENARDAAQAALDRAAGLTPEAPGPDLFSRTVQADVGVGVGLVFFGMAMGALFAVVYAVCLGRVGRVRPRTLALLVAGAGFLGFYLVPFLKYPANPPAIGHEDTIKARTGLYLVMVVCSVALLGLTAWLGRRLQARFGTWNATLLAGAFFVVAIGVIMAVLPSLGHLAVNREEFGDHATETPQPLTDPAGRIVYPGFPADVLFTFRLYSVGAQLLMWGAIALVFGPLAERVLAPAARSAGPVPAADPVGA